MSKIKFIFLIFIIPFNTLADIFVPYADVLLRYENETNHQNIRDRERLVMIAALGAKGSLSSSWSYQAGIHTGRKDKQNVAAISISQLNGNKAPDREVFVNLAFALNRQGAHATYIGKMPWQSWQVTDAFWDRHLKPIGVHYNYQSTNKGIFSASVLAPLDGAAKTVGSLSILQWSKTYPLGSGYNLRLAPWVAMYKGEPDAQFAKRDTQYDNNFINLSTQLSKGKWKLGADISHSISDRDEAGLEDFAKENTAYSVELAYGGLKKVGMHHISLRFHHVERFAVVTEFAQNALTRIGNSNIQSLEARLRYKMGAKWWLGTRLSRSELLIGDETATRFRVEAKYVF